MDAAPQRAGDRLSTTYLSPKDQPRTVPSNKEAIPLPDITFVVSEDPPTFASENMGRTASLPSDIALAQAPEQAAPEEKIADEDHRAESLRGTFTAATQEETGESSLAISRYQTTSRGSSVSQRKTPMFRDVAWSTSRKNMFEFEPISEGSVEISTRPVKVTEDNQAVLVGDSPMPTRSSQRDKKHRVAPSVQPTGKPKPDTRSTSSRTTSRLTAGDRAVSTTGTDNRRGELATPNSERRDASVLSTKTSASTDDWEGPNLLNRHSPQCWNLDQGQEFRNSVAQGNASSALSSTANPELELFQPDTNQVVLKKELCLYPLSLLLLLVTTVVLSMLITPGTSRRSFSGRNLMFNACVSPSCIQDTAFLSGILSWDLDPCDNFYAFVCNRWTSRYPSPRVNQTVSTDDDYAAALEDKLYELFQNNSRRTPAIEPLRRLFERCVSLREIEDAGWDPILELLYHVSLEGFPLTPPVRSSVSVWKMAGRILRKTGTSALFRVEVAADPSDVKKQITFLRPPDTLATMTGMNMDEIIRVYTDAAFAAMKALNKDFVPPVYTLHAVQFASDLEKLYRMKADDHEVKIEKLGTVSPLREFLNEVFVGVPDSCYSSSSSEVLVESPDFLRRILELVRGTEAHTVMNFLGVRLMVQTSPFLPQTELTNILGGLLYGKSRSGLPRWRLCIRVAERALSPLVHLATLDVLGLSRNASSDYITKITQGFLTGADSAAYFNSASKVAVRHLVSQTQFKVLSPTWLSNRTLLDDFVQKVSLNISNGLDLYITTHEYTFVTILARGSSERWGRSVFNTDCWYDRVAKAVHVPGLLFNRTLAEVEYLSTFQLSRTGIRLGRCIFDRLLSETNSTGTADQWLNPETESNLAAVQRCIGGERPDERAMTTLRDASVVHFVYRQFEASADAQGRRMGLRFGHDRDLDAGQLFFIYLVLQSCEKWTADQKAVVQSGVHLNNVLRNEPAFHERFHCAPGSVMNPQPQCTI